MPIYVYQIVTPQGDGAIFEMLQPLHAPALTRKPDTGEPVRRVITAPNLPLRHGGSSLKNHLSSSNLARHGFTRYEREGPGRYVRTAGDAAAPAVIAAS